MHDSKLEAIDLHLQENEEGLCNFEGFLQTKETQLRELQNFILSEFKEMEVWNDQRDALLHIFNSQIKTLTVSLRQLCTYIRQESLKIVGFVLSDAAQKMAQQSTEASLLIRKQEQEISYLKAELDLERRKLQVVGSSNRMLPPNKSNLMTKSTTNLDWGMSRSKSREGIDNWKDESRVLKRSSTKQIMREVQKNLREDHENMRNIASQKQYVKGKIELLKMRHSGLNLDKKWPV